jgi:hypothetical protein
MTKKISLLFIALVFILGLAACGPKVDPDQAAFDEAYQALSVVYPGGDSEKVIASFTLPTSLRNGVTATWESNDTTHAPIVTTGAVTSVNVVRPENGEGNATVKLTATLTLNNVTDTKEFTFTILEEPFVTIITLSEIKASEVTIDPAGSGTTGPLDGQNVRILDVTVIAKDTDAYWISDGTTSLMVYESPANVQIGQKGDIITEIDIYYGAWQLKAVTWKNVTQNNVVEPTLVDLSQYWIANKAETVANMVPIQNDDEIQNFVTFEAKIVYRKDFTGGASYMTTLVDPDSPSNDQYFVLVYYKSPEFDNIAQYSGITATFTATVRELRYNRATNATIGARPIFSLSIHSMELPVLTEEDFATIDANNIEIPTALTEGTTITLPKVGDFDSVITWSFTNADDEDNQFVNLETGVITMPTDKMVKVSITATIVLGSVTLTRDYEMALGNYPLSAIGDIIKAFGEGTMVKDTPIRIKGILTGGSTPSAFWIQDATGGMNIYVPSALRTVFATYPQGIEIEITGFYDNYNGLHEIYNFTANTYKVTNTQPALPSAQDISNAQFTSAGMMAYHAEFVKVTGLELKAAIAETTSSFNFYLINSATSQEFVVRLDNRMPFFNDVLAKLMTFEAGDIVDLNGLVVGWFNGPQLVIVGDPFKEPLPITSIGDVIAGSIAGTIKNNDEIKIQGILLGGSTPSAFWLQDETGGINLYVPSALRAAFAAYDQGIELELTGKYELYNGLHEIKDFTVRVVNETPALPASQDVSAVTFDAANMLPFHGELVKVTGLTLKEAVGTPTSSFNFYLVNATTSQEFMVRLDNRMPFFNDVLAKLQTYAAGDVVNIDGLVVGWFNTPQLVFVSNPFPTE